MNSNAYTSGSQKVIPAVLIYAYLGVQPDREFLMIYRSGKDDFHTGKWNGLGGKFERGEGAREAASREFAEESGIRVNPENFDEVGSIFFPNFKPKKSEDWWVSVLTVKLDREKSESEVRSSVKSVCAEGQLHWVSEVDVLKKELWKGDEEFVPHVLSGTPFMGTIWYRDGELSGLDVRKLRKLPPNSARV